VIRSLALSKEVRMPAQHPYLIRKDEQTVTKSCVNSYKILTWKTTC